MVAIPLTVVEVEPFAALAKGVWSEAERAEFVDYIARNPLTGTVIQGAGGIRKVRWSRAGTGKRGGVRVIYFYHSMGMPIFLLTIYAKSVADNLTAAQKKTMARLADILVARYGRSEA